MHLVVEASIVTAVVSHIRNGAALDVAKRCA